jgi:hypothetical protein
LLPIQVQLLISQIFGNLGTGTHFTGNGVNQELRVRFACIIAALMPLVPGKTLRPYDIIPREVHGIGAVQNKVKAA